MDKLKYFASFDYYDPRYLDACLEKINDYRTHCKSSGKFQKWQRALQNYYGVSSDGTKSSNMVTRGGDAGQLTMAKVSDYRNIIQHQLILITSQRPAGEAKAINSDTESLHNARIGSSLVEFYLSQVGYEQRFVRACEISLFADESFAVLDWDATSGDPVRPDPETGRMIKTGDLKMRIIAPWNMSRDPFINSPDDMTWGIYGWRLNKFDLATKFPNQEREIIQGGASKLQDLFFEAMNRDKSDQGEVFCLAHQPTDACEKGRLSLFVQDAMLLDVEFPYPEFNIYRMSQNDVIDTGFGYSNNNDILALEEVTDALHSAVISNQITFATQAIVGPKGGDIVHSQLGKGFLYLEMDPALVDKIRPLQLTKTAPEVFQYMQVLDRKKETFGGINSVVRGDPEGALRSNSGSALALISAQSLQFNSGGQRSYYHLLNRFCTGMIKMLQKYADSERVIQITGKVQAAYLNQFKYDKNSLTNISSVVFELTDPISKSIGGRQAIADNLLQKDMVKNASQYINVVRTGSLDIFTEDDEIDNLAIKEEDECFRKYEDVEVVLTENHEKHIQSHMSLIASPQSKKDGRLMKLVLDHVQKHTDTWQQLSINNPALLIATKQKVLPNPNQGAPGPGPNGPMPQPPAPHGPPGPPPANLERMNGPETPLEHKAGMVRQPLLPMNPATHQRAPMPSP